MPASCGGTTPWVWGMGYPAYIPLGITYELT